MLKSLFWAAGLAAATLITAVGIRTARAAETSESAKADKDEKKSDVSLAHVVLFNSGVGFFDRKGQVDGDAQVELKFNVGDVNDLLKSMVLQDLGGGHVSTVTYGSKDPITKTLKTFAIDLTSNPTLGQILNQARGERVHINEPNNIEGIILGVERRKKEIGRERETINVEVLNLLTDEGLRNVPLDSVGSIKLLNEKLDKDFRQALKVLSMGHDTDKKTVTLNFLGNGKRQVRVGYVQQTPIWKTSYRLVLKDDEAPFLQGWAMVENTTEEDWNKVNLTLVSGRPISFIMDLYQPLYVQRPLVEPELFASLRPQKYSQDLSEREMVEQKAGQGQSRSSKDAAKPAPAAAPSPRATSHARMGMGGMGGGRSGQVNIDADGSGLSDTTEFFAFGTPQGVQSASQAADVGELFQYEIATPVTLPRQQSAMLPIVNESVKGKKLSIYNQSVQAKHPLNGLRLTNATDLHLMQGPITVFDGGAYAGDARIEDMQPGSDRLISYALDLDTEVAPDSASQPDQITRLRIVKGVLFIEHKHGRTQKYTVKNSGKKAKTVLVEYPLDSSWKLVTPKEPTEKTRDLYRFAVDAQPNKPATLEVSEERTDSEQVAITNLDDNMILFYAKQKVVSDKVKSALQEVVKRKSQLAKVSQDKQRIEQEIQTIGQEQDRIRQNMVQLDRNTDLYKRYVKKFGEQEDAVEKLREQSQKLADAEASARKDLDDYLAGLELD